MYRVFMNLQSILSYLSKNNKQPKSILPDRKLLNNKYYVNSKKPKSIWCVSYGQGNLIAMVNEWTVNPVTKEALHVSLHVGPWGEKTWPNLREINVFEAESRFPGCTRGYLK